MTMKEVTPHHDEKNRDVDKGKANIKKEQQKEEFDNKKCSSGPAGQSFHPPRELSFGPQGVQDITKYLI